SQMSSHKKKATAIVECGRCGCSVLAKDDSKHKETCDGDPYSDEERSLVVSQVFLRGSVQHIAEVEGDLPENTFGWAKRNIVLVHPSTLRALDVQPRQPVVVFYPSGAVSTALLWPSSQVSPLRIWLKDGPKEQQVEIRVLREPLLRSSLQLRVEGAEGMGAEGLAALQQYLQAYLRGGYLLSTTHPLTLSFCGRQLSLSPAHPAADAALLDAAIDSLTLEDGDAPKGPPPMPPVIHVSASCTLSLTTRPSTASLPLSSLSWDAIPGLTEAKTTLHQLVIEPRSVGLQPCSVVLYGLPGTGKSLLLQALGTQLAATVVGSLSELVDSLPLAEMDGASTSSFSPPSSSSSLLIADVNDLPTDKEHIIYRLIPEAIGRGLTMVLGVRSIDDLPLPIRVRFAGEIETGAPSEQERAAILRNLVNKLTDEDAEDLARRTHAFTAGDLVSMARVAACDYAHGGLSGTPEGAMAALTEARARIRPTGLRQFALEVPTVQWKDIAGNEELKMEIEQAVIWPLRHRDSFIKYGIAPPSGILLYGPPGCSKTLIARALAHESKMNFISVKGPELFSKWVGDSEKAIRQLFARARQVRPSIVFFDEIDAVGTTRGANSSGGGVNERVLAQLLTELDGLESNEGVVLLAATNRPDQLDSALLRPGRLDRALYVPLPTPKTREALLHLRSTKIPFDDTVDLSSIVSRTDLYSGAELVAVCQTAALAAMRDDTVHNHKVHPRHFDIALSAVRPRTDRKMLLMYDKFAAGAE
ncbi:cdc-48.3, partial [Pristionchus pacificus]